MHYYEVAPARLVRPEAAVFTYASPGRLSIGQLVTVELGKRPIVGIVTKEVTKPAFATKEIVSIIEPQPLPEQLIHLAGWMSSYYATHLSAVLQTLLPTGLTKKRRAIKDSKVKPLPASSSPPLNSDQQAAVNTVHTMTPGTALLHGITGSGKTNIYMTLAYETLKRGQSVIVLVPEIALTPQLLSEFSKHFGDIILTHSHQTEAQRHAAWLEALHSEKPRVVIGPRSALFLPLRSIGLIVIDEAHEPSFKQEQSPRYSALRAASMLAHFHGGKLILGSATPLVADYYLAETTGRPIIQLTKRAIAGAAAPDINVIDTTKKANFRRHRFLSDTLLARITETLESGGQSLMFHNRRGSANVTLCENCGWSAVCPQCFLPLTLHADKHHLRCHVCGLLANIPTMCPQCRAVDIVHKGVGTKLIETELRRLFPHASIARFDGDNAPSETVEKRYDDIKSGEIQIIIGTQVIAKGLDLPRLRVVAVIQADSGLSLPDYSAGERVFQLLAQVVGRVGRFEHKSHVLVQSYQPTHPAVVDGLNQDYEHFYKATLLERKRTGFPPFRFLLKLTCLYKTEAAAISNARELTRTLKAHVPPHAAVFGPAPAFYERQGDTFRWQIVVKSPKRSDLQDLLRLLPPTHWQYELDPFSLL